MKKQVSQKQLSQILNVTPQAVGGATARGLLFRDDSGLYDLTNKENAAYLKSRNIDVKKIVIPQSAPIGRPVKPRKQGAIKTPINSGESLTELNREKVKKQIEKIKIENEYKRGQLLDAQLVQDMLFLFLDKVFNSMERNGLIFLTDNSARIINAGGVTSQIKNDFKNLISEQFDSARNETIKRIEKIREAQK